MLFLIWLVIFIIVLELLWEIPRCVKKKSDYENVIMLSLLLVLFVMLYSIVNSMGPVKPLFQYYSHSHNEYKY
jgi:hypothetical protein